MVTGHDSSAELKQLFVSQPEIMAEYLLSSGRLAILLLDLQGTILDCNPFFLESVKLAEKPVGQTISAFSSNAFPPGKNMTEGECQPIKFTFALHHSLSHALSGNVLRVQNRYLIFANTIRLTDHELMATLSKLTDELTDMTRELNKKNRELAAANQTITQLMNTDPLTGLTNRRHLEERLDTEMSAARRHSRPLAALMTDIDHFKSINDTYGHDAGDKVLVKVAQALQSTCRKEDIVARYGGEEFIVILPDSPAAATLECAERIRKTIQDIRHPGIDRLVTASFGATLFLVTDSQESLIKRADTGLYEAKESGRNRVVLK